MTGDKANLLYALREDLAKTCVKDGCAPSGQCGACSVLVDGKPRLACVTPLARVAGKTVTTPDGLSEPLRTDLARAFVDAGAFDCGFCIPGILVRAHQLLSRNSAPTRKEIGRALIANVCRCTGWAPIVAAIESIAAKLTDIESRIDLDLDLDIPLGRHRFLADDVDVEYWIVPVVAGVADGEFDGIAGCDGALITAESISCVSPDRLPILDRGERIRDPGDVIALAIGRSLSEARACAESVRPIIVEHPADECDLADECEPADRSEPELSDVTLREWLTVAVDPGFVEPEAASARLDGENLTVRSQTETPWEEQARLDQIFESFHVELEIETNGGSYGGKAGPGPEVFAAAAAVELDGSTCCVYGRRESILRHRRRHPVRAHVTLDVDGDGRLRRIDGRLDSRGGGVDPGPNPYQCPTSVMVAVEPGRIAGPIRGDGIAQFTFVLEQAVDRRGVDRAESLRPAGRSCLAVVSDADGVAITGSDSVAVAAGVHLAENGSIAKIVLAYCGALDDTSTRTSVISGAYMGAGLSLSEHVPMRDGVPMPATIRSLGLLRCAQTPPIEVVCVEPGEPTDESTHSVDEFAVAAVPAAIANAVRSVLGEDGFGLPMLDASPSMRARRR